MSEHTPNKTDARVDAVDVTHQQVRRLILQGELAPGARLTETQIAEALNVSRTPVREAFRRLEADGFVKIVRNRGAFVSTWTEADLEEIYGLRFMLESYGARIGAEKIGDDQIRELERLATAMELAVRNQDEGYAEECAYLNTEFHAGIVRSAGNQRLSTIVSSLTSLPLVHRSIILQSTEELRRSWSQHRDTIEAMRIHDGACAEALVRSHIYIGRSLMRRAAREGMIALHVTG